MDKGNCEDRCGSSAKRFQQAKHHPGYFLHGKPFPEPEQFPNTHIQDGFDLGLADGIAFLPHIEVGREQHLGPAGMRFPAGAGEGRKERIGGNLIEVMDDGCPVAFVIAQQVLHRPCQGLTGQSGPRAVGLVQGVGHAGHEKGFLGREMPEHRLNAHAGFRGHAIERDFFVQFPRKEPFGGLQDQAG